MHFESNTNHARSQAAHALTNLGYKQQQIDKWLQ